MVILIINDYSIIQIHYFVIALIYIHSIIAAIIHAESLSYYSSILSISYSISIISLSHHPSMYSILIYSPSTYYISISIIYPILTTIIIIPTSYLMMIFIISYERSHLLLFSLLIILNYLFSLFIHSISVIMITSSSSIKLSDSNTALIYLIMNNDLSMIFIIAYSLLIYSLSMSYFVSIIYHTSISITYNLILIGSYL